MAPHGDDGYYHAVDAVRVGTRGALITGTAGLFAASIKNALATANHGALGVFTQSSGMIFTFGTPFLAPQIVAGPSHEPR